MDATAAVANYYTQPQYKLPTLLGRPFFFFFFLSFLNECFKGVINRLVSFLKTLLIF